MRAGGTKKKKKVEAKYRLLLTRFPNHSRNKSSVPPALKIRITNLPLCSRQRGRAATNPRPGGRHSGCRPLPSSQPSPAPRSRTPRAERTAPGTSPHPSHQPPSPRGQEAPPASLTSAQHKHTPSPQGPPGAAALPGPRLRVPPRLSRGSGTFCSFLFRMG